MSNISERQSHLKEETCHKVSHCWWPSAGMQRYNSYKTVMYHSECLLVEISEACQGKTEEEKQHLLLCHDLYLLKKSVLC